MAKDVTDVLANLRACGFRDQGRVCGLPLGHHGRHAEVHIRPFRDYTQRRRVEMVWADGSTFTADL